MKILFFSGLEDNKMSLYRGHGVLSELHKLDNSIQILNVPNNYFNPQHCKGYDLAYFHRPEYAGQVRAIETLKKMNIPVIVDYDDDFTTCPEYSPYHTLMSFKENDYIKNVCDTLLLADLVIVSTDQLKRQYSIFNNNIHVIRNAFDDYLFDMPKGFNNESKTVFWRGGHTHQQDLFLFKNEIEKLIIENEDFNFVFQGKCLPDWLRVLSVAKGQKNLVTKQVTDVFNYFWSLQELKPALVIVPLEDNSFNKSKSDIALLEATISGAIALCPYWEEWNWSSFNYKNNESFYSEANTILEELRANSIYLKDQWDKNISYVKDNRLLSQLNIKRLELIKSIVKTNNPCNNINMGNNNV